MKSYWSNPILPVSFKKAKNWTKPLTQGKCPGRSELYCHRLRNDLQLGENGSLEGVPPQGLQREHGPTKTSFSDPQPPKL